jgi:hypothetical protein
MALIAVSTEDPGIVRIFFDLRAIDSSLHEEDCIASAIEEAFGPAGEAAFPDSPARDRLKRHHWKP